MEPAKYSAIMDRINTETAIPASGLMKATTIEFMEQEATYSRDQIQMDIRALLADIHYYLSDIHFKMTQQ